MVLGTHRVSGSFNDELALNSHDALIEAALCGTWTNNVLKNGLTRPSFSFYEYFGDITGDQYELFKGVVINSTTFTLPPTGIATVAYTLMGQDMALVSVSPATTVNDSVEGDLLISARGSIQIGGATVADITNLTLTVNNNVTGDPVIGSNIVPQFFWGSFDVNGSISAELADNTLTTAYIAASPVSIVLELDGVSAGKLTFDVPKAKLSSVAKNVSGMGAITLTANFQGLLDTVTGCTIQCTRSST